MHVFNRWAAATERIAFGTGVTPIFVRHPALLAQEAATLDQLSGGRFNLGIGTSHTVTVEGWCGQTLDHPVSRMREYTAILRQLFTTGASNLDGKHYTSHFAFMGLRGRPEQKIFWAAMGPKMLRAAAELADGVCLWMCSPSHIRNTIRPLLEKALADHGRSFDEFDIVAAVPCGVTEDVDAGRDLFRGTAMTYWSLPFYRKEVLAAHPEALAGFDAGQPIPDDVIDEFAGIGSPEVVRAKVEDYRTPVSRCPPSGSCRSRRAWRRP